MTNPDPWTAPSEAQTPPAPAYGYAPPAPAYGSPWGNPPENATWGGTAPRNGLGIAGLVLALVALLGCWLPFAGWVALPIALLAIVFGAIAVHRVRKGSATNRGVAMSGLVLAIVVLLLTVLIQSVWISMLNQYHGDF